MNLRPYQQDAIDEVKLAFMNRNRRVLLVAPTGAGKTVMFSYIAKHAALKGNRIAILAHREELLDQISRTLTQFGVDHGFIAARRSVDPSKMVQVCGVHTLKNRAARIAWTPDLIVCDEAHHATAGSWARILEAYSDARVLGVTATPERLDGTGLGNVFTKMVRGPEIADLIAGGFLSPVKYYCPKIVNTDGMKLRMGDYRHADVDKRVNNSKVTGEAVEWYRKLCDGSPAVAFCASIAHSEHVAQTFRAAGYRWTSLDSTMTSEARRAAVVGLGNGSLHGISSCDIISEGFDLPIVSTAILLRPTASLGLYLQQVGRVLRVAPGKTHATIIDHVGNCGSTRGGEWIEKHGFAEDVREWSLEGRIKRAGAAPVRLCEECFAVVPISAAVCPQCGAVKPEPEIKPLPEADAGELEEVIASEKRNEPGLQIIQKLTLEYLQSLNPKFNAAYRCIQFNNEAEVILPNNGFSWMEVLKDRLVEYMKAVYWEDKKRIKQTWREFVNSPPERSGYKEYLKIDRRELESNAMTLEDWQNIAKMHGYHAGWAWHRFNLRKGYLEKKKNRHLRPNRIRNSISDSPHAS
jgi:superfamily II DNA or RNA helicase